MVVSGAGDGLSSYPSTPVDAPPVTLPGEVPTSRKSSGNSQPEINPLVSYITMHIHVPGAG